MNGYSGEIIFIDSDTYSSSAQAFRFVLPIIQKGSYVILDDYFSYKGDESKGVSRAFKEFKEECLHNLGINALHDQNN